MEARAPISRQCHLATFRQSLRQCVPPFPFLLIPPDDGDTVMNRLGEVVIAEHEDFDKWGIEIRCSFRDNEPLRKLTAQRQSGGVHISCLSFPLTQKRRNELSPQ